MRPLNPDEPARLGDPRILRTFRPPPLPDPQGTNHAHADEGVRTLPRVLALITATVLLLGMGLYSFAAASWSPAGTADTGTGDCSVSERILPGRLAPPNDPQVAFPDDVPLELSFSPDGSILAVSQIDTVTLWDWERSRVLAQIDHDASALPPTPASFSPDGCMVAYGTGHGAVVVDLGSGKRWTVGSDRPVRAVAFSPDGSSLAVGVRSDPDGRMLHLHDTATWEVESRLAGSTSLGAIRYSLDGSVVAGGENGGGVTVWNVDDPRPTGLIRDRAGVGADAFDLLPDGSGVLIIRSGTVLLVDPTTEEVVREYVPGADTGVLVDVAYSAASGRVFAARLDPVADTGGMVAWEYGAATEVALGPDLPRVFPMALSEDGSRVAGLRTGRGDIAVHNTELSLLGVLAR